MTPAAHHRSGGLTPRAAASPSTPPSGATTTAASAVVQASGDDWRSEFDANQDCRAAAVPAIAAAARGSGGGAPPPGNDAAANSELISDVRGVSPSAAVGFARDHIASKGPAGPRPAGSQQVQGDGPGFMVSSLFSSMRSLLASAGGAVSLHPHLPGQAVPRQSRPPACELRNRGHLEASAVAGGPDHPGGVIAGAGGVQKLPALRPDPLTTMGVDQRAGDRSRAMALIVKSRRTRSAANDPG